MSRMTVRRHKCAACGKYGVVNDITNPMIFAPDPYSYEIYDDETLVWEHAKCRDERRDEI